MARYCKECGSPLADAASFCPVCGHEVNAGGSGAAAPSVSVSDARPAQVSASGAVPSPQGAPSQPVPQAQQPPYQQPPVVNVSVPQPQHNGMGIAGFVCALVALFFGGIPVLGWLIWLAGLICSCVGMRRQPKGLAIAGLVISLVGIIVILAIAGCAASLATSAMYY